MKEFKNLESGILVNKIEREMDKVRAIKKELAKVKVPKVDLIAKAEVEKKVSQYVIDEEIEKTLFAEIEDAIETYESEIEVKRVDGNVVYTLIEEGIKVESIAELDIYDYEDAVMIAKHRAIIKLQEKKIEKIRQKALIKRAKKVTREMMGMQ